MWLRTQLSVFLFVALLVAGCGGGGNSFPDTTQSAPPSTQDPNAGSTNTSSSSGSPSTGSPAPTDPAPAPAPTPAPTPTPAPAPPPSSGNCRDGDHHDGCNRSAVPVASTFAGKVASFNASSQMVGDQRGNVIAVWRAGRGALHNLTGSCYCGGNWQIPVTIETRDDDVGSMHLAVDGFDNGILVWDQSDGVGQVIWAARSMAGTWGLPQIISLPGDPSHYAYDPRLQIAGDGSIVATWSQLDAGMTPRVWANHFSAIEGWGTPRLLDAQ